MTATLFSHLSLTLNQRRWAAVLDPTLVLSDFGLALVKQLGDWMELWVVREFWHILDNTHYYLNLPELVRPQGQSLSSLTMPSSLSAAPLSTTCYQPTQRVLREWETLRMATDVSRYNFYWIGDGPAASYLPDGIDAGLIGRWEALASGLDSQIVHQHEGDRLYCDPLLSAYRDAAALSATLGSAVILTYRTSDDVTLNLPPRLCRTLTDWQIQCDAIAPNHPMMAIERDYLRQLLVHANLAKLIWAGLDLVVLHLVVPTAASLSSPSDWVTDWSDDLALDTSSDNWPTPNPSLWDGACGFWYSI